jgi:diguanylate cyclase (GGDEF)-like protein/PAS domain S-box-containing protein
LFKEEQIKLCILSFMEEINSPIFSEEGVVNIFKTLIESMNEGLIVTDKKGSISFNNRRVAEILQYENDNFQDLNVTDLLGHDLLNHYNKSKSYKNSSYEIEVLTFKGKRVSLLINQSQVYDKIRNSDFYILTVTDITKRVNSEKKLKRATEFLKKLTIVDGLSGLYNFRYFEQRIAQECDRSSRYENNLCLLMIDIDLFKVFNDINGHCFGDFVLKEVSSIFSKNCRRADIVFRNGGDEFSFLLPNTDYEGATRFAAKIRKIIENYRFERNDKFVRTTISTGVSSYLEEAFTNKLDFMESADEALLVAKKRGGNNVVLYKDIKSENLTDDSEFLSTIGSGLDHEFFKNSYESPESIVTLIKALETKDPYSEKHSMKVMNYALLIARKMKLSERETDIIKNASLMHDVGKIGVSDTILLKKDKLNTCEFSEIKKHPEIAVKILKHIRFMNKSIPCILHHHEWYNGHGYPDGLKAEEIPIGSRIIAIADAFDAMTSERPYRGALPIEVVIDELKSGSGKQFCPKAVQSFLSIIEDSYKVFDRPHQPQQMDNVLSEKTAEIYA